MPSTSAAQHRYIGYLHSNPTAAKQSGMSRATIDEWLHSDKGKPWERRAVGGRADEISGGGLPAIAHALRIAHQGAHRFAEGGTVERPLPLSSAARLNIRGEMAPDQGMIKTNTMGSLPIKPPDISPVSPYLSSGPFGNKIPAVHGGKGPPPAPRAPTPLQNQAKGGTSKETDHDETNDPIVHGFIKSTVPGRTDKHNIRVYAGSYVIPADIVAGLGQGNSLAGSHAIHLTYDNGPWGHSKNYLTKTPVAQHSPEDSDRFVAEGAAADARGNTVPVVVAGGEDILTPWVIMHHHLLGGLDPRDNDQKHLKMALQIGHEALDEWVVDERKKQVKEISKLPGPVK